MQSFIQFIKEMHPATYRTLSLHLSYGSIAKIEEAAQAYVTAAKREPEPLHGGFPVDPKIPVDLTRSTGANNAYGFDDSIKL